MSFYDILVYLAIAYYLGFYSSHMVYLALGYKTAVRWKKLGTLEETHRLSRSIMVPPISLVAELDLSGEEAVRWVDHILSQRFPEMELLVMVSAGNDPMVENLVKTYFLRRVDRVYRRVLETPPPLEVYQSDDRKLTLVLVEALERGMVLNLALNMARYPLVAVAGRGVVLEDDALLSMVRPIMEGEMWAPAVMGVVLPLQMEGGNQFPSRRITRFSLMESLRLQLGYQAGVPYLGGPVATYSPLLLFHKKDLLMAGGFDPDLPLMGAEMDMLLRLHKLMREERRPYRFVFLPQLLSRHPFPRRWINHFRDTRARRKGLSAALWAERGMLFRARYGRLGMFNLPIFWLFIHLAAVLGFIAYAVSIVLLVLGKIGLVVFCVFLASSLVYPALVGVGAIFAARRELGILGGHGVLIYGYAFFTQLWFRQLTALASLFPFGTYREEKS